MHLLCFYLSCFFNCSLLLIFLHNNYFNSPNYFFYDCIKDYDLFEKQFVCYSNISCCIKGFIFLFLMFYIFSKSKHELFSFAQMCFSFLSNIWIFFFGKKTRLTWKTLFETSSKVFWVFFYISIVITFTNMINIANISHTSKNQTLISFVTKGNNSCLQQDHFNDQKKTLKDVFLNYKMTGGIYYLDEQHENQKVQRIIQTRQFIRHPKVKYENDEVTIILCLILLILIRSGIALCTKSIFFIFYLGIAKIAFRKISLDTQPSENLKLCRNHDFFTIESNQIIDKIIAYDQYTTFITISLTKLNSNKRSTFFWLLLLLSWDIEQNPGPLYSDHFQNKKGLHFVHININSLLPKIDELRHFAKSNNIAVLGITESKLDPSVSDSEIQIEGYELLRCDRNRHGGGVACFICKKLCFNIKNVFPENIENIFVDILLPKTKPFTVGILYRPPTQHDFVQVISSNLDNLSPETNDIYILGDLNINTFYNGKNLFDKNINHTNENITFSPMLKQYRELCVTFSLKQIINLPTRITSNSISLIDHILTNASNMISGSGVIDIGISDHQMIYCTRKMIRSKYDIHKNIKCRSFKNYDATNFVDMLRLSDFPNYETYTDINHAYSDFISKLTLSIDQIARTIVRRLKNMSEDWFDSEIFNAIRIRNKYLKKFKKTRLVKNEEEFKEKQTIVRNLVNFKKKSYFENKLKMNIGKPKELWKTLKNLGLPHNSTSNANICLINNEKTSFNAKDNANLFKDFFSNLANNLFLKLPEAPKRFGKESLSLYYDKFNLHSKNFNFCSVSKEPVLKIIQNLDLSKASGIDTISVRFIKDGANVLAVPISQLFNLSIKTSSFPDDCKISKLKPLYKKGSKTDPKNYRPISLLPIVSKIIEKLVHDQAQNYLSENNVLYDCQSGFRKNYSTNYCLAYLNDKISKGFDQRLYTGMILIDLQKAFDTINHLLLLEKMAFLGFSEKTIKWFKSYLTDRKFIVYVNEATSDPGPLSCGVPQGSILGPLLFLLYVNDMPQATKSELLLYADDSCILFQHKDVNTIQTQLNEDFSNLCDWFVDNKLSIHFGEEKTKSILFASKWKVKKTSKLEISYKSINIKQHSKVTYLGCIIDETLSGESMALNVINKISSKIKFLYRKNRFLTPDLRRLLCNSLIQPHFDYACSSWYPFLTQNLKNKIQIMQNKCIRFCLKLDSMSHIGKNELEKINWLNTYDRYRQNLCTIVFNSLHGKCPLYISEIFDVVQQGNRNTRFSYLKIRQPFRKTNMGQKSISYTCPGEWNKLPNNLKSCQNANTFKHQIKKLFLNLLR